MMRLAVSLATVVASVALAPSCIVLDGEPAEGEGEGEGELGPTCTEPVAVPCEDEVFIALAMDLNGQAPGLIDSLDAGGGLFEVDVDSRAGGFGGTQGWVYGAFTDEGLLKVEISDGESLGSMDWDIAFRRFVVRVNSGFGGPSCVTAARTAADTSFDDLAAVPEGLRFNAEQFMSDEVDCTLVPDGSGLGSPGVVLQNWWEYPGCVKTTGNVYVLSLKDGRRLKLEITQYYGGDGAQDRCNDFSETSGESGRIRLRYAFL